MHDWLLPVQDALEQRTSPATIFFRDDDAGWDDIALHALLDRFAAHGLAIDLAAIPTAVSEPLARRLLGRIGDGETIGLHQHGFGHANHQHAGRKCEFGDARGHDAQHEDIDAGYQRLRHLFGERLDPIFTPPWNRCTQATADVLNTLGFASLSRDRTAAPVEPGALVELPVTLDWSKWMRGPHAEAQLAEQLSHALAHTGPCGIMLHHADMSATDLNRLESLLGLLTRHPAAHTVSMASCVPTLARECTHA